MNFDTILTMAIILAAGAYLAYRFRSSKGCGCSGCSETSSSGSCSCSGTSTGQCGSCSQKSQPEGTRL